MIVLRWLRLLTGRNHRAPVMIIWGSVQILLQVRFQIGWPDACWRSYGQMALRYKRVLDRITTMLTWLTKSIHRFQAWLKLFLRADWARPWTAFMPTSLTSVSLRLIALVWTLFVSAICAISLSPGRRFNWRGFSQFSSLLLHHHRPETPGDIASVPRLKVRVWWWSRIGKVARIHAITSSRRNTPQPAVPFNKRRLARYGEAYLGRYGMAVRWPLSLLSCGVSISLSGRIRCKDRMMHEIQNRHCVLDKVKWDRSCRTGQNGNFDGAQRCLPSPAKLTTFPRWYKLAGFLRASKAPRDLQPCNVSIKCMSTQKVSGFAP